MEFLFAAEGEEAPNPLLPASYDIIWSAVVFVVLVVLFYRYVLPRYLSVLDERRDRIEGGIKRAEEAQEEARLLREQHQAELAAIREDAGRVREEARAEGAAIREEIRASAESEAARIIEAAQRQIQAERQQAAAQLRREVGRLAVDLAERVVGEALADDARQQRVVDRFLAELEEDTGAASGTGGPDAGARTRSGGDEDAADGEDGGGDAEPAPVARATRARRSSP
jgi:F-type H+-transporting ATPase subunit b